MKKMRKLISLMSMLLLIAPALPATAALLHDADFTSTADVVLLDMENTEGGGYLFLLDLPDGRLEIEGTIDCQFFDNRRDMVTSEAFLKGYKGKRITVTFMAMTPDTDIVTACFGR